MALKDKYKELIDAATGAGISDLKVRRTGQCPVY